MTIKRTAMKPSTVALKRTSFARVSRIEEREVSKARKPAAEEKPPKGPKPRKCAVKGCRKPFMPARPFITWCSEECGTLVGVERLAKQKAKEQRADRAETKRKLAEFKPLGYHLAITERHCNAYVRARDADVCISCGVRQSSAWQAGHYISVGANGTIRFHEDNIHKQCIKCNMELAGNAIQYRIGLIAKIGIERVEWLESWHPPVKMTAAYAQEVAAHYRAKLRALKSKTPNECESSGAYNNTPLGE